MYIIIQIIIIIIIEIMKLINKCLFINFSNIFLNKMPQINVRKGLFSTIS